MSRYPVLVLVFAVIMAYAYGSISYENAEYATWELHDYRAMALASPGLPAGIQQPFLYRILGPFLAGALPVPVDTGFRLLSFALGVTLALVFYLYLSSSTAEPRSASLATIFFVCNKYFFGFPVWNYYELCDLLSFIALVLLMWSMTSRQWLAFGVLLFAGALAKETVLLMIPVAFVYLAGRGMLASQWKPVLAAVIPATLGAVALRIFLVPGGGNNLAQAFMTYGDKFLLPETWFRLLVNSFIPFAALPLIFSGLTRDYFRTRMHELVLLVLVLLSTGFGYNDERLMAPAFIVFYPLIAAIMHARMAQSLPMIAITLGAAVIASLHHTITRFPIPREISVSLALAAFALVTLSAVYFRIRMEGIQREHV